MRYGIYNRNNIKYKEKCIVEFTTKIISKYTKNALLNIKQILSD
jgi:hypothetical protein